MRLTNDGLAGRAGGEAPICIKQGAKKAGEFDLARLILRDAEPFAAIAQLVAGRGGMIPRHETDPLRAGRRAGVRPERVRWAGDPLARVTAGGELEREAGKVER